MRHKDENKQDAIIKATVKLVNEIGFVASSVAKIAKEANVSPATIYIYYKNKEDLLVSTYIGIKQKISDAIMTDFNPDMPIRDILKKFWFHAFEYIAEYPDYFQFTEQFSYSPYSELVDKEKVEKYFEPIFQILNKGIEQKIIKNVTMEVLSVFMFYPVMLLANPRLCANFQLNAENIETAFTLAWDAIKL
ncbi:MAG: TetR/AcrR family transcriptional regulator [bacterium]|nr:TetR/AcrR family transcriptional regulator [bacterium]